MSGEFMGQMIIKLYIKTVIANTLQLNIINIIG
jgi:hypothetical protein